MATRSRKALLIAFLAAVVLGAVALFASQKAQFLTGGALVNMGFRLQDPLEHFDFDHDHSISPEDVWREVLAQNQLAASVRKKFPRTARHPVVAMVVCMDARIDTNELVGDTRKYYYIVRTAGSVLSEKEEEMLELAVDNGVKVLVLTRHTDCAAEKAAADPAKRAHYPSLTQAVGEREMRVRELLARPHIAEAMASGRLLVKQLNIDTMTEELLPATEAPSAPTSAAPAPAEAHPADAPPADAH